MAGLFIYKGFFMRYHDLQSWLSTRGEFFPLVGRLHLDDATKHSGMQNSIDARNDLFRKGWMRVTFLNASIYVNNPKVGPNSEQKRELIDLAILRGHINNIMYDNDDVEKMLWTKDNIL